MLVFDGVYLFFIRTTQPHSKTSAVARFRRWLLVFHDHHPTTVKNEQTRSKTCAFTRFQRRLLIFHHHHPTTLENEQMRLFSMVVSLITHFGVTRRCLHLPTTLITSFCRGYM